MTTIRPQAPRGGYAEEGSLSDLKTQKTMQKVRTSGLPMPQAGAPGLEVVGRADFVETPFVHSILDRAMAYIEGGFPIHFRGPTGCGKTTLALQLAQRISQPMMLLVGDDEFATSDLIGGEHGYSRKRVIDNFIHSVMKTEDRVNYRWVDARLTMACQQGYTLIYDEFSRSRPEANNVFLPVLEERILILPTIKSKKGYLRVHPDFRAVFTSNPTEYAGVHPSQEALVDRMITIDISHFDRETELLITRARTGVDQATAERIVDVVRGFRDATETNPTVRNCIMIGKIIAADGGNLSFGQVCLDVMSRELNPHGNPNRERRDILLDLIGKTR
jgi:nitric oxide reductase NorQ protein